MVMSFITTTIVGRRLLKPSYDQNLVLFKHCSEGMIEVTPDYFELNTKPLLKIHGVTNVYITEVK